MSKQEKKSPAFQLYPKDFLSSEKVDLMNNEQLGAYFRLICKCWINDGLPDDEEKLAILCGGNWDAVKDAIMPCLKLHGNKLWNPRLLREKKSQEKNRKKKSEAGKKSASLRKSRDLQGVKGEHVLNCVATEGQQKGNPSSSSSSSPSSNPQTPKGAKTDTQEGFNEFWEMYPKKVDKKKALAKWQTKKCYLNYGEIIIALGLQITHTWANTDKQFICGPAVWLNGEKWNDEIITPTDHAQMTQQQRLDKSERESKEYEKIHGPYKPMKWVKHSELYK